MFHNLDCELIIKTTKDDDGIKFELVYNMNLNKNEMEQLKEYRENFGKSSPIHFHFNDDKFSFSQKKYLKKKQFIDDPPIMSEIESNFLKEINVTLNRFKNLLNFENLQNSESSKKMDLTKIFHETTL